MFTVIDALKDEGHNVIPLALAVDRNRDSIYEHYFLKSPFGPSNAMLSEAKLSIAEKFKLANRAIYYPAARRAVKKIIERERIDVVYLLNICNYISPSIIDGAKDMGVRTIMRLSDFNFICASYSFQRNGKICMECKNNLMKGIRYKCVRGSRLQTMARTAAIAFHRYSGVYKKVDAFVCPSRLMARELLDFGIERERVHYVPSFVKLVENNGARGKGRYALYFGRISKEKGVEVLVDAWRLLGGGAPILRIIGSGPEEVLLRKLVDDYQLENVEFLPFLEHKVMMDHLRSCAFVVIPSVCHDNAPMAAIEAMAQGKVVVASRVGGLPDQVQDGVNGVLVQPGDARALANAITTLIGDPDRMDAMGDAARLSAERYFNQQAHMNKLLAIFEGRGAGYLPN